MTKATRTVEWASKTGAQVVATIIVARGYQEREERINLDGDVSTVTKRDAIETTEIRMAIGGKDYGAGIDTTAYYLRPQVKAPESIKSSGLVLKCGETVIGISMDNAERVKAAIAGATAEAEADPEWAAILTHRAEIAEVERHSRNVERMMTLDGHTY